MGGLRGGSAASVRAPADAPTASPASVAPFFKNRRRSEFFGFINPPVNDRATLSSTDFNLCAFCLYLVLDENQIQVKAKEKPVPFVKGNAPCGIRAFGDREFLPAFEE